VLFEKSELKGMRSSNRLVMSAAADPDVTSEGRITDGQIERMSKIAEGGVGLLIMGAATVHPRGQSSDHSTLITTDDCIPFFKKLTSRIHETDTKIALELTHSGLWCSPYQEKHGWSAPVASLIPPIPYITDRGLTGGYKEATEEEILEIVDAYGQAARRARESGFDAVELHGAHDSLLAQFASPLTNRREDRWGGSTEDRIRIHHEALKAIRKAAEDDFPVLIKIGVEDAVPDGLEFDEGKRICAYLSSWGYDALEVSQNLMGSSWDKTPLRTKINKIEKEGYFRPWCREINSLVEAATIMQGGMRSFELAEEVISKGEADLVGMCRPLIKEPGLINDWMKGDYHRATCVSCNKCAEGLVTGQPLKCRLHEKIKPSSGF